MKWKKVGSLEQAYNQFKESAIAVALRNYNSVMYSFLLQTNLQICEKCVQLMKDLPTETRRTVNDKELFKPLTHAPGRHRLLSKCFLATEHVIFFGASRTSGNISSSSNRGKL